MCSIVEKCGRVLKVWCIVKQKEVVRNIVEHCGAECEIKVREIKVRVDQCEVLWSSLEQCGSVKSIIGQC